MKTLLYIGHSYHNKTRSTQFLQDMFKTKYNVDVFNFDPSKDDYTILKKLTNQKFDVVILFQIMPSINMLKEFISFKSIAFFPMYDMYIEHYLFSNKIWLEYKDCNIINFSKTLHDNLLDKGFSSYYIQYFPESIKIDNFGDEKSIFFWQRTTDISAATIDALLEEKEVKHLHIHKALDPNHYFIEPNSEWKSKVTYSTWYEKKEDMLEDIKKAALYIAPRRYEGIGMSFLEAMAMRRCVIAPNNPTMNEYIVDGQTGILYDLENPHKISLNNIQQIQKNTQTYIQQGYQSWESNKNIILDWIIAKSILNKKKFRKYRASLCTNAPSYNIKSVLKKRLKKFPVLKQLNDRYNNIITKLDTQIYLATVQKEKLNEILLKIENLGNLKK
ncbi:MAG: glycosyltransferase [Treponemataceae bacterium]